MSRVRLESGLKLNLPKLVRQGLIAPGQKTGPRFIRWTNTWTGEVIVSGHVTAELTGKTRGWIRLQLGKLDQWIELYAQPRHFGGKQWYFHCPYTGRECSVLWMPPGAKHFASRQRWARQVAYGSQFESWHDRALSGARRIRARLDRTGNYGSIDDPLPPKPKWMRWRTYDRLAEKCEAYEDACTAFTALLVGRLSKFG